ncbi:MAG: ATP synthase F1 subunit delta [Longimicrobiales bacterium]
MRDNTVARSYAEALFELGQRTGKHQDFAVAVDALGALLSSDRRVRDFLNTPRLDADVKKNALRSALGGRVPPLFLNFVLVVFDKRRQRVLPQIAQEYRVLLDEHLGLLNVEVALAHEPDERAEEEITAQLSRILGRKVIPHIHVDSGILGGIVVRYGDRLMDGSLRHRLVRLRERMLEVTLMA